jgi:hypothetical protein
LGATGAAFEVRLLGARLRGADGAAASGGAAFAVDVLVLDPDREAAAIPTVPCLLRDDFVREVRHSSARRRRRPALSQRIRTAFA